MPADVTDALLDLSRVFGALGVRWYVFGAQAVIAAGVPRLTADVDVTAEVPPRDTAALLSTLDREGFALREVGDLSAFIAETRVVPAVHRASKIPVDIILAGPGLEEQMLARARMRVVRDVPIPFVATPDLIALKVLAGRDKDLEDVRALVRAAPPDLALDDARARLTELAELLEDPRLLETFERAVTGSPTIKKRAKKRAR